MPISEDFVPDVLPAGAGLKILGTKVTIGEHISTEIRNRMAAGFTFWWIVNRAQNQRFRGRQYIGVFCSQPKKAVNPLQQDGNPYFERKSI